MVTKKFFNGSHGNISYVKIDGEKDFPTIVFMDGMGGASNYLGLKSIANKIDNRYTKLFIDRLGVCESDETNVPRTWENIVFEIHELLTNVIYKPVIFFAHSASGPISLAYSSVYPNEVLGIISIEPTSNISNAHFQTEDYQKSIAWLEKLTDEERNQLSNDSEWTEAEKLEEQRTEKPFVEGSTLYNEYFMLEENLESISHLPVPSHLPILLFFQPFREKEYRSSEFSGEMTTYISLEGHHHLHRVHPDEVAKQVNRWLDLTIKN